MAKFHDSSGFLEKGVLAELDGKPAPDQFAAAITEFEVTLEGLGKAIELQREFISVQANFQSEFLPEFEFMLAKILKDIGPLERASDMSSRYSTAGGLASTSDRPSDLDSILKAQLADMLAVERKGYAALDAFRSALPLAEEGRFVPIMLSGRNAFGDLMPEFSDMITAFDRFYVKTCMATITATMQTYPKGWEWLEKR